MDRFMPYLQACTQNGRNCIICGDWNIAHKEIDLKNWRGNQKNSGFLPEERAWLDQLFVNGHWLDAFRLINQEAEQYTWWSNRGQAWAKNVGWRIDYQIIRAALKDKVIATSIYKDERFSDHAPLIIDYNLQTGAA
jgi:exodeoxyribonuclease-3